ncbi:hypothetical protein [Neomoorella thermoacetica]|uniref:hypothetical protein n=1 Tax=Neomoorella thermoacetica TaxID=1525 RepID=UPI0030D19057
MKLLARFWNFPRPGSFSRDPARDFEGRLALRVFLTCVGIDAIFFFPLPHLPLVAALKAAFFVFWVHWYFLAWLLQNDPGWPESC